MKRFRIHQEARAELRHGARWLEEREEGLGIELLAKFDEKLTFALESPKAGKLEGTTSASTRTSCGTS